MPSVAAEIQPTLEADFTFAQHEPFALERGGQLSPVTLHYAVYGDLERHRDRVVLACHALSGSARVADWWASLFGAGRPFDPERCCIIGVNLMGSCYGSTGPTSLNPATGRQFGPDFPIVTVGDNVRSQALLLEYLGVEKLLAVVGGSIGGMQALEWALRFPNRIQNSVSMCAAPLNAMGLALNHLQRQAIWNDPAWNDGHYERQPAQGLGIARAIAMCSYKSAELFEERYGRKPNRNGEDPGASHGSRFDVAGYLDHQEKIFLGRFDANTYVTIMKMMDLWDLPNESHAFKEAAQHGVKFHLVGISSDWLFPAADVRKVHDRLVKTGNRAQYHELKSAHGHDAFLADAELMAGDLNLILHGEKHPAAARFATAEQWAAD